MAPQLSDRPILCAVLDGRALGDNPEALARDLFLAGVDWIQLRDRDLEALALEAIASSLVAGRNHANEQRRAEGGGAGKRCRVIVNRRLDVLLCSGADGAHLGFDALCETRAHELLPENLLLGRSFHSIQEIESHASRSDSILGYAHLAPIWDPFSKEASRPAVGLECLSHACAFGLPILAQGGVDPARAREAVAAGAAGVAVTGQVATARNPMDVARQLRRGIDEGFKERPDRVARRPLGAAIEGQFLIEE